MKYQTTEKMWDDPILMWSGWKKVCYTETPGGDLHCSACGRSIREPSKDCGCNGTGEYISHED